LLTDLFEEGWWSDGLRFHINWSDQSKLGGR